MFQLIDFYDIILDAMERKERQGKPRAPALSEQGKGQKEKKANNSLVSSVEQKIPNKLSTIPEGEKKIETVSPPLERRGAVFECVLPKSKEPRSLFWIQRMLGDGQLKIEEVPALEQQWFDNLKTMDRQILDIVLKKVKGRWEDYKECSKRKVLTAHGRALLLALEEDIELMQEELRQRE